MKIPSCEANAITVSLEILEIYGIQTFISVFRTTRHFFLSWAKWIQFTPSYSIYVRTFQYYPLIYASAFEVTFLHQIYPRKHFSCVLLFSHAHSYMPSLPCYIIVDVKFSVIIFYSKASSTRTCINCVFRRPRKRWRDQLHLEDQGTGNTPNPSGTWWWWRI